MKTETTKLTWADRAFRKAVMSCTASSCFFLFAAGLSCEPWLLLVGAANLGNAWMFAGDDEED